MNLAAGQKRADFIMQSLEFDADKKGPLDGVRVLDLTRLIAGNMLTLQLADFGAEVVKIEPVGKGDPLRAWTNNGIATFWKVYCRNKKSIALDFRSNDAAKLILSLVKKADVLVENFRPGRIEQMGLGPDVLFKNNPKLVVVRVSGFGQTGPYSQRPGFGTLVEAMSGFASRNGFPDRPPLLPPLALADMIAGLQGAYATMVALREVELKGGMGQVIDLSLLEPILSTLGPEAFSYQITNELKERVGNRSNTSAPRDVYLAKDGKYVALSASIQTMAERVFRAIGRADMIDDTRYKTNADRVARRDEVNDIVAEWIGCRDRDNVLEIFEDAGITASPVYDVSDIIVDKHIIERGVIVNLPDDDVGLVPQHNVTPRLSGTPGGFKNKAPVLGEHTDYFLVDAGFSGIEIESLRAKKIIEG
jgi:crotonobetainyl-CoA:carnitine CoA-transferase CaiB-like acyl-CoA transferase